MTEWILSSSILIVSVIGLRTVLKGKISLRLQYALWGLVLLRLLIPVSFGSSDISVANLTVSNEPPAVQSTLLPNTQNTQHAPNPGHQDLEQEIQDRYESQGIEAEVHTDGPADFKTVLRKAADILWASGFAAVAGVFLVTNSRFRRKIMESRYCLDIRKNHLDVYATGEVDTPCLFGIRNPVIYVTYPVADDPTLLRHTLEHEATHYRHGDHIWALLRCVCLAIHWYNPLVWWAAYLSQRDAELACDEATIRRLGEGERAEYGRTLIGMTCRKKANVLITATTMNSGRNGLRERILLIAKKPKMAVYTLLIVILATSIAVGCTFTGPREDRTENPYQLEDSIIDYCYEKNGSRGDREDYRIVGMAYDYALVHYSGMGPTLTLYRYKTNDNQAVIQDWAGGEYTISGCLSVNHLVDGDKHIYFGAVSDYHYNPQDDTRIEIDWKSLVFWDGKGNQKIVTFYDNGYLIVMDEPMTDFWVGVNGGDVPLKMEQYLAQGYAVYEAIWDSEWFPSQGTDPSQPVTEPSVAPTEIPDNAPPVNIPEIFHEEPDPDKVCIAVLPTAYAASGEGWYYIIPENQELLLEYYQKAEAKATKQSWDSDVKSLGWMILYQDVWWTIKENGAILCDMYGDKSISSGDASELFTLCRDAVREAGIGEPVRPEDIQGIISATLSWNGTQTVTDSNPIKQSVIVTDPYILKRIETLFSNSRDYGSVQCWMDARLELALENGETLVLAVATDNCSSWMSEGCCYSYGEVTNVGIEGNEEFYSFFLTDIIHEKAQEGPEAMASYWPYMHWGLYTKKYGAEDTLSLLYMFEDHLLADPSDWNIYVALTSGRGIDGAYAEFYAHMIGELFEAAPKTFSLACRQMVPEQYVEDAVDFLAYYWEITTEEARARLEAAAE